MNVKKQSFLRSDNHLLEQGKEINTQNRYGGVGFNVKKRPKRLIKLVPLGVGSDIEAINRIEQDLLRDIRDIDNMLHKQQSNMTYINGFLFSYGTSKQLIKQFYSAIQLRRDAIQSGFYLWRLKESNQNYQLVSSKLVHSPPHFPKKLLDKSIQNLQNYDRIKNQQSIGLAKQRWNNSANVNKITPLGRIKRFKTDFDHRDIQEQSQRKFSNANFHTQGQDYNIGRKMTDLKQSSLNYRSQSNPLQLISDTLTKRSKQKEEQNQAPSIQQLTLMLKKQQHIIAIWHPPSTCPQLMGVISIEIKEKSYNLRYCLIKKYYWYRHGLSRRLFDSILRWICLQFDSVVQLAIVTDRQSFNGLFSGMGWHLNSWINEEKIKITYNNF